MELLVINLFNIQETLHKSKFILVKPMGGILIKKGAFGPPLCHVILGLSIPAFLFPAVVVDFFPTFAKCDRGVPVHDALLKKVPRIEKVF
ncbi:MAG: hypothetical protein UU88_C0003G0042 [Parcubacteria group bacterium GW2011_GWC1_42_11]|uniref:Uncharacterized protein n=1 Tax=Candidatus Nomurabacteria bacterium GW2011_GWC2_42_20 TaxID=1618756 RepID=A0A0G0ZI03_9BACT|nr:MAG: hypothetical protein UU88_C0003G0042 [Parcubacteria group bacterium GW2011_GWC1_42_11]KKS48377.1 MAG: hypothetical protein UV12_C0001G0072 [Candidatus Nomurabacteria bacterium GW2011_GWC2_42_20]KKS58802.1 MAG: hypothetical protein UV24_C0016G0008 [Candidatus Nomurabacteria bacterium GW2011_GWA2_42_41]KKT09953.1 MAG: hypothetical protein UV86_C0001G0055 [Candidatus Nomurabacteria bacterium GW2011_GWB1_43_20]